MLDTDLAPLINEQLTSFCIKKSLLVKKKINNKTLLGGKKKERQHLAVTE